MLPYDLALWPTRYAWLVPYLRTARLLVAWPRVHPHVMWEAAPWWRPGGALVVPQLAIPTA